VAVPAPERLSKCTLLLLGRLWVSGRPLDGHRTDAARRVRCSRGGLRFNRGNCMCGFVGSAALLVPSGSADAGVLGDAAEERTRPSTRRGPRSTHGHAFCTRLRASWNLAPPRGADPTAYQCLHAHLRALWHSGSCHGGLRLAWASGLLALGERSSGRDTILPTSWTTDYCRGFSLLNYGLRSLRVCEFA